MRLAKEGTPIPGGYALTELGARTLNNARLGEANGHRATALEKMILSLESWSSVDSATLRALHELNDADIKNIFDGQRRSLPLDKIKELIKHEKAEMNMT